MVEKKTNDDHRRNVTGSAIAGAGAVAAGTGLVAGGVPGGKSDFTSVLRMRSGEGKGFKRATSTIRGFAPAAKAAPGGITGFRTHAHKGGLYGFEEEAKKHAKTKPKDPVDAFYRGRNAGKIAPEKSIIRGMTRGRGVANATLAGGVGAAAFGSEYRKPKERVKKAASKTDANRHQRRSDSYNATLAGAGGTGAVAAHAGSKYLDKYRKTYEASASSKVDEAGKLVPGMAGRQKKKISDRTAYKLIRQGKPHPRSMYPTVSDGAAKRSPHLFANVSNENAEKAGKLRGGAAQERHFAEVFGSTSKVVRGFRTPAAIAGAAGAGGLAASHKKPEVKKSSHSAFGVDHAV